MTLLRNHVVIAKMKKPNCWGKNSLARLFESFSVRNFGISDMPDIAANSTSYLSCIAHIKHLFSNDEQIETAEELDSGSKAK